MSELIMVGQSAQVLIDEIARHDAELAYRYFPALFGVVISSSATKDERLRKIAEMAKEARWYHERGISPEDALRGGSGDE